jgi:hypothetical protein
MDATRSSETYVHNKPTRRHITEHGMLHSHRRETLKSYTYSYRQFLNIRYKMLACVSVANIQWGKVI